jgi:hypothetical protein
MPTADKELLAVWLTRLARNAKQNVRTVALDASLELLLVRL